MRLLFLLLAATGFSAIAAGATGGKGAPGYGSGTQASSGSISAGTASRGGGGGGSAAGRINPRNVPPLAKDRKINEQDCSKPVDWTAGNLKCK